MLAFRSLSQNFVHLMDFPPSPETGVAPEDDITSTGRPEASGREEEIPAATSTAGGSSEYDEDEEEVESEDFRVQPRARATTSGSTPLVVSPLASAPPAPGPSSSSPAPGPSSAFAGARQVTMISSTLTGMNSTGDVNFSISLCAY